MEERTSNFESKLSLKAEKEILNVWLWYEERKQGLGDQFTTEVRDTIVKIEKNPEHYHYINRVKDFREARLEVFLYLIVFKIDRAKSLIRIVSVFHTARSIARKYKA